MKSRSQQGLIINPRGVSGSGKTELVRRVLEAYDWEGRCEAIYRSGRQSPIASRLEHPFLRRPLVAIGHYAGKGGGCDRIPEKDGGLDEIFRLASHWTSHGQDVILEGSSVSSEYRRSLKLAEVHSMCVLLLSTPLDDAARNLVARRHLRRAILPIIVKGLATQADAIGLACAKLRSHALVEHLAFDNALRRVLELLDLPTFAISIPRRRSGRVSRASARRTLDGVLP